MSEPAASSSTRAGAPEAQAPSGDDLVRVFNEARAELVSTLYFMLGNYEDALDAAQEAFVKCWRARAGVAEVRNLRAWVFRVGLNAAKDLQRNAWYRRAKPLTGAPVNSAAKGLSPLEAMYDAETRERLRRALLELRPEEKEVFLLRQNATLTYEEIAKIRRCPVGTVKTQMRAALRKLRQVLQEKSPP
jgi:RNA polymerase sigma-70 factor (ECF subfamily)